MPNNPKAQDNLIPFSGADDPRRITKPKGAIHLSTRIKKMLDDDKFTTDMIQKDGTKITFKGNPAEAIIKTAILKAMSGDKQWADWLAQNGYGTKHTVEVEDKRKKILEGYNLLDVGQAEEAENSSPQDAA